MLRNAEAGALLQETEPGEDAALGQVVLGVVEQVPADRHDGNDGDDLE